MLQNIVGTSGRCPKSAPRGPHYWHYQSGSRQCSSSINNACGLWMTVHKTRITDATPYIGRKLRRELKTGLHNSSLSMADGSLDTMSMIGSMWLYNGRTLKQSKNQKNGDAIREASWASALQNVIPCYANATRMTPQESVCRTDSSGTFCIYTEHQGHRINPFSLHVGQSSFSPYGSSTLWLPEHCRHGTNFIFPHPSHTRGGPLIGSISSTSSLNPSASTNRVTTSAPPMWWPRIKSWGTETEGVSSTDFNSDRNSKWMATSLSSNGRLIRCTMLTTTILRLTRYSFVELAMTAQSTNTCIHAHTCTCIHAYTRACISL